MLFKAVFGGVRTVSLLALFVCALCPQDARLCLAGRQTGHIVRGFTSDSCVHRVHRQLAGGMPNWSGSNRSNHSNR